MFKTDWIFVALMGFSFMITIGIWTYMGYDAVTKSTRCTNACDTDPVKECYNTRAVCVGSDKIYIKSFPNE